MRRITLLAAAAALSAAAAPSPQITYTGHASVLPRADGGLPPVVGVENIQVYRANRAHSEHAEGLGDTYVHAPMLAWWHGRFHLDFLTAPVNEHDAPTSTSYTTSEDGVHWVPARVLFPAMPLPGGGLSVMHQRMSFYVAPNDRLLAAGFHGKTPSPNDGSGFGRVVREIRADGTLGQIYFIRFNQKSGLTPTSAPYPFFTASTDAGFVEACRSLLANRLVTAQWWEEDRSDDGFYRLPGKAISIFHRADGKAVAVAKDAQHAVSSDEGQSWERLGFMGNMPVNSSKYWGQRTSDGRYVLVLNPTNRLRHPLALLTSADGQQFDGLLTVHSELPVQRFPGKFKNMGPQYVRGISEGNGTPPDGALWLTYSVNKEDIWVARVPVPIGSAATGSVSSNFSDTAVGAMPAGWNIYRPLWAPVQVVDTGDAQGRALELRDEDPCDYAEATRVFPACRDGFVRFKLLARQINHRFEIDLTSTDGARPVQIALTENGRLEARHEGIWMPAGEYRPGEWLSFEIELKAPDRFILRVNGQEALARTAYVTELVPSVERLVFRTGAYRERGDGGHEIPGADVRAATAVFLVDDVSTAPAK